MKILAIDDNPDNLVSVTAMLRSYLPGCDTTTALSGAEGIEKVRTFEADAILLDVQMPGMDGFETCRRLKADPLTRHIPVIFLTARMAGPESRIRGLEIGGDAFLTKPVEPDELVAQVRAMYRIKVAEDALRRKNAALEGVVDERSKALEAEVQNVLAIFDASPVAMLVLNENRTVVRRNPAAANLASCMHSVPAGQRPGDVLGCVHGVEHPHGCGHSTECSLCPLRDGLSSVLAQGTALHAVEIPLDLMRDGVVRSVCLRTGMAPLLISGKKHMIIALDDITDLKRTAEELELNNHKLLETIDRANVLAVKAEAAAHAKSDFLSTMSHEIRTPLNGVIGFADLLRYTSLDESQREFVDSICDSGSHLLGVVNEILDFSRIEKGMMPLELSPLSTRDLIESACVPVGQTLKKPDIRFHYHIDPDVPELVKGDSQRIRQILSNLLDNAVKFTLQGEVELTVSFTSECPAGTPARKGVMEISIADTGIGMSPAMVADIFSPFTQGDSSTSRKFGGSGLGLAIAKRLAHLMGGDIHVLTAPGKGSTFTFALPVESIGSEPRPEAIHPRPGPILKPDSSEIPRRVLVAEDNNSNRRMVGLMLERLGCTVDFAGDGLQAVEAVIKAEYDLVLMDMQMPELDGIEATKQIRTLAKGKNLPIIALTANAMEGDRERCLLAGMNDYLAKPVKSDDLAKKLAALAGRMP